MASIYHKSVAGVIPARFESSRFPGKMLASICGKSLIQRTYENALKYDSWHDLIVATDDSRIYDHVESFNGKACMTPLHCPTGTDRTVEVLKKVKNLDSVDIIVNVQGDEPCLDPSVIHKVVELLIHHPSASMATAATQFNSEEAAKHPSNVKCIIDQHQNALYFSRGLIPCGHSSKWTPESPCYHHIGIYAYRKEFLLKYVELPKSPLQMAEDLEQLKALEYGFQVKVAIVDYSGIGVDHPEDIKKVEQWLCKQNIYS